MGYREWRERQLAKVDAKAAQFDARSAELDAKSKALDAERAKRREDAAADAHREWALRRAAVLREDHDDLLARAAAVGMGAPSPGRASRGGVLGAVGELVVMDGAGVHGERRDPYREWRDRIVLEEQAVEAAARGEQMSLVGRAALKSARMLSR